MYVIHKVTRIPTDKSYSGSTWDKANLRDRYKEQYESEEEALLLAKALEYDNPVGFAVARV
jgi:hypothetical protein